MPEIPVGGKIREVSLKAATNGFIVQYDVMGKRDSSPLSDMTFIGRKEKVFGLDQGQDALATLVKLSVMSGEMEMPEGQMTNESE